jgi:limonene-1,2-epoxide hydrolase
MLGGGGKLTRRAIMATLPFFGVATGRTENSGPKSKVRTDTRFSVQKEMAEKVVKRLVSAARDKDIDAIHSILAANISFKATPYAVEIRGRDAVVSELRKFIAEPFFDKLILPEKPQNLISFSGEAGTAILMLREDLVKGDDGALTPLAIAAAFWVVGGKIHNWFDWPLGKDPTGYNWSA